MAQRSWIDRLEPGSEGTESGRLRVGPELSARRPEPLPESVVTALVPFAFYSSKTVCSMTEVGGFNVDVMEGPLSAEVVNGLEDKMQEMNNAKAFTAATANNQVKAAELLRRTGFEAIATWPGNACERVTFWFKHMNRGEKKL